jgi:hypothetical protein
MQNPSVTALLAEAFAVAHAHHPKLMERWVALSSHIGGLLPASGLMMSVQEVGRIDTILRATEDERREAGIGNALPGDPMASVPQFTFSGI